MLAHQVSNHISRRSVVNALIGSYRSSTFAPDQLLAGIGKWWVEFYFLVKESSTSVFPDSLSRFLLKGLFGDTSRAFKCKDENNQLSDNFNYILSNNYIFYCFDYEED